MKRRKGEGGMRRLDCVAGLGIGVVAVSKTSSTYIGHILNGVIGRFLGDGYIMRMAFSHARGADSAEPGVVAERINILCSAVSHTGSETANELIDEIAQGATIGDASFDAFGDELSAVTDVGLAVAIF